DANLPVGIGNAGRVAHQTTGGNKLAYLIDCGNPMSGCERDDLFPMGERERPHTCEERASAALDERREGCLDVALALNIESNELLPDRLRRRLHVSSLHLGIWSVRTYQNGNRGRSRHELAKQLQSLRSQHGAEKAHPGDVAARPVEARDEAVPHRIGSRREDDRHRGGCGLSRKRRIVVADDRRYPTADQIGGQIRQPIKVIFRRVVFDRDVPTIDVAGFLQALAERGYEMRSVGERRAAEESDYRHRRLLRARRERPRCSRAAEERDELASLDHSITSSASASTLSGRARPRAFAALRLITSSNFVGNSTGRSAGFAPLRMRPAYTPARR